MRSQAKRHLLRLAAIAGAAALLGAVACAAKVQEPAPDQEATTQDLGADGHRHLRGPVRAVFDAARSHGNLTAAQRETLETISRELEANRDGRRQLRDKLRTSAVAVVRSGTARSDDFDQSIAEAVAAFEKRMDDNANALEELHGTLRPEQRAAVAVQLRVRIAEKLGPRRNDEQRHQDGFKRFASHLMLSTFQIDKLKAMKKELLGEKERLRPTREELFELVDAFEGEEFRSALNAFRAKKAKILRKHLAHAGERTDTVLSLLSPEQRDLLADLIQDGPRKVLLGQPAQCRQ